MICAYDKVYLDKARVVLARMMDFAVYDLHYKLKDFFDMFLASGIATCFERGDAKVEYLLQLSSTLCCEVECLIERVGAYED